MPNLWDKTYANLLKSQELVEIYRRQGSDDTFGLDRILGVGQEFLGVASVDTLGAFDGYRLLKRDEVFRIHWGSSYAGDREPMAKQTIPANPPTSLLGEVQLSRFLEDCRHFGWLCDFAFGSRYTGRVLEFDEDCIVLELYDENKATLDGPCLMPLEDLLYVAFKSQTLERQEAVLIKLWGL